MCSILILLTSVYLFQIDAALEYATWSYDSAASSNNVSWSLKSSILKAHCHVHLHNYENAIDAFIDAFKYAENQPTIDHINKSIKQIAELIIAQSENGVGNQRRNLPRQSQYRFRCLGGMSASRNSDQTVKTEDHFAGNMVIDIEGKDKKEYVGTIPGRTIGTDLSLDYIKGVKINYVNYTEDRLQMILRYQEPCSVEKIENNKHQYNFSKSKVSLILSDVSEESDGIESNEVGKNAKGSVDSNMESESVEIRSPNIEISVTEDRQSTAHTNLEMRFPIIDTCTIKDDQSTAHRNVGMWSPNVETSVLEYHQSIADRKVEMRSPNIGTFFTEGHQCTAYRKGKKRYTNIPICVTEDPQNTTYRKVKMRSSNLETSVTEDYQNTAHIYVEMRSPNVEISVIEDHQITAYRDMEIQSPKIETCVIQDSTANNDVHPIVSFGYLQTEENEKIARPEISKFNMSRNASRQLKKVKTGKGDIKGSYCLERKAKVTNSYSLSSTYTIPNVKSYSREEINNINSMKSLKSIYNQNLVPKEPSNKVKKKKTNSSVSDTAKIRSKLTEIKASRCVEKKSNRNIKFTKSRIEEKTAKTSQIKENKSFSKIETKNKSQGKLGNSASMSGMQRTISKSENEKVIEWLRKEKKSDRNEKFTKPRTQRKTAKTSQIRGNTNFSKIETKNKSQRKLCNSGSTSGMQRKVSKSENAKVIEWLTDQGRGKFKRGNISSKFVHLRSMRASMSDVSSYEMENKSNTSNKTASRKMKRNDIN